MQRFLRCYAEGRDEQWEAICLDLDIAVQGRSMEEVFHLLHGAIGEYIAHALTLPADEQRRFLHRSAPLGLRLMFLARVLRMMLFAGFAGDRKTEAEFLVPVPA